MVKPIDLSAAGFVKMPSKNPAYQHFWQLTIQDKLINLVAIQVETGRPELLVYNGGVPSNPILQLSDLLYYAYLATQYEEDTIF